MPSVTGYLNSIHQSTDLSPGDLDAAGWAAAIRATGVPNSSGSTVSTDNVGVTYSAVLLGGDMGFNIPAGSTINAVSAVATCRIVNGGDATTRLGNFLIGTDKASPLINTAVETTLNSLSFTDTVYNLTAGEIALLTPEIINSTGFYLGTFIEHLSGAASTTSIDAMWLTITYTEPVPGSTDIPFYKTSSVVRNAGKFLKY